MCRLIPLACSFAFCSLISLGFKLTANCSAIDNAHQLLLLRQNVESCPCRILMVEPDLCYVSSLTKASKDWELAYGHQFIFTFISVNTGYLSPCRSGDKTEHEDKYLRHQNGISSSKSGTFVGSLAGFSDACSTFLIVFNAVGSLSCSSVGTKNVLLPLIGSAGLFRHSPVSLS